MRTLRTPVDRQGGDEGVAILLVVMAMLVLSTLSALALGALIVQFPPTTFQRKSNQTINAAEAGLSAALSTIRTSTYVEGTTTFGDRSLLPCWSGFTGQVGDPAGAALTYSVTIGYFGSDPSNQTAAWRAANAMPCVPGIGTLIAPSFAFITAAGNGPTLSGYPAAVGNRTLQSTYIFSTTNPNLPGGLIKDYNGLCYSGSAVAGTQVTLAGCLAGADTQMWAFTTDFEIVLTSTRASDGSGGMCISARPASSSTSTASALMKSCDRTDFSQKWGINGNDPVHFFGHLLGAYAQTWCLGPSSPGTVDGPLMADSTTCGTGNRGIYPQAAVGAGAAGTTTKSAADIDGVPLQWVNYQEFGRCMDVTGWNVSAAAHIIYPCKQDPMLGAVAAASPGWNEVFTWSSVNQHFWVNKASSTGVPSDPANPAYCMKSPASEGGYVAFSTLCASATTAPFNWTVNRDTGDAKTSYTIVDSSGRCLSNGPKNPSLGSASSYSTVITVTCDGGNGQKWNAPANLGTATLSGVAEVPNH